MAIKRTASQVQSRAEEDLQSITDDIQKFVVKEINETVRNEITTLTKTEIVDYEAMVNDNTLDTFKNMVKFLEEMQTIDDGSGKLPTKTLVDAFNKARRSYMKGIDGMTQSHKEFSVMAQQCFIIYVYMNKLAGDPSLWSTGAVGQEKGKTEIKGKFFWNQAEATRLAKEMRNIWIAADVYTNKYQGANINLSDAIDEYMEDLVDLEGDLQQGILGRKEKYIDVLTGKVEQKIVLEDQTDPKGWEQKIGRWKSRTMTGAGLKKKGSDQPYDEDVAKLSQRLEKKFGKIAGSKLVENEVTKQLADIAMGKKSKAYSSKTKVKSKGKSSISSKAKLKASAARLKRKNSTSRKVPPVAAKVMAESGGGSRMVEALKLKKLINKRLPAEVRRNMGRPALINRTGRFSDSVELTDVRVSPKGGFSGDYTYRLSPYETFENQGVRRWPTGYNPKNLITKSIRNLAIQYTTQQFSYLRRT